MRTLWLGCAAAMIGAASIGTSALARSAGPRLVSSFRHHGGGAEAMDGHRRGNANAAVVLDSYGGEWAATNNRSWDADSYNDWWNDRPDRAYPRWVQEQRASGTCSEDRMWWSGSGWHC